MNPLKLGSTRTFFIEGGARPDHQPRYESCWRAGAIDQAMGDITKIECPNPDAYNSWIEIASFQGAEGRVTTSIMGRLSISEASEMRRLATKRCVVDIQVHASTCTEPSNFNDCEKAIIFEDAFITNYSTPELGALESGGQGVVDETAALSAARQYEALPISFAERGASAVTNPVVDVVICDALSCGDCTNESDGCETIFAIDNGTTGSPGTAPDVVWSTDKGVTFAADDVDSLLSSESANAIACLGNYVVVVSHASDSIHYKLKATITAGTIGGWTEVATGIVAAGSPLDAWSVGNYMFVVGDGGYVYGTSDPTSGVTVLDAGVATVQNLAAVHALNSSFAVAVGAADAIIYTTNGTTWQAATATGGGGDLQAVWIVNENQWWVGDDNGDLWYTLDGGVTWTEKVLPGTLWSDVNDIQFATKSVGYIVADKSTTKGYALQTWDGGYSWTILPRQANSVFPGVDSLVALAACEWDPNFVVTVGTADDALDGVILVGED